jgi:hypothetical protein
LEKRWSRGYCGKISISSFTEQEDTQHRGLFHAGSKRFFGIIIVSLRRLLQATNQFSSHLIYSRSFNARTTPRKKHISELEHIISEKIQKRQAYRTKCTGYVIARIEWKRTLLKRVMDMEGLRWSTEFDSPKIWRLTNSVRIGLSEDLRDTVNLHDTMNLRDTVKNEESV